MTKLAAFWLAGLIVLMVAGVVSAATPAGLSGGGGNPISPDLVTWR